MNKSMIQSGGYVLLAGLILAMSSTLFAADNNLHFSGNLLSKSCALVVDGQYLAEVRFPTVSRQDLNVAGQSARVPVVFMALDTSSTAQGVGIGMEKTDGMQVAINNTNGATFALTNGNNDINFRAWLQAKSGRDVTIGEFTASLTATFEYI